MYWIFYGLYVVDPHFGPTKMVSVLLESVNVLYEHVS